MIKRLQRLFLACLRWVLVKLADALTGAGYALLVWEEWLDPGERPLPPASLRESTLKAVAEASAAPIDPKLCSLREAANEGAKAMKALREALPVGYRCAEFKYPSGPGREITCHVRWEERQVFDPRMVN